MMDVLRGVAHGRIIELESELALPEGQAVTVMVQPVAPQTDAPIELPPGEGIRRSAGGWSDDPEGLDQYLEWNRQQRKIGRREIEP
jgi:hypothetical protein